MSERGLEEWAPDPVTQHHLDEARYIRDHARPTDDGAKEAVAAEHRQAGKKRRKKIVSDTLNSVKL